MDGSDVNDAALRPGVPPGSPGGSTDGTRGPAWRRRAWALAVLAGSGLLHVVLLAWLDDQFATQNSGARVDRPVSVALLKPPAVLSPGEAQAERVPPPPPAVKRRPRPPAAAPEPGVVAAATPPLAPVEPAPQPPHEDDEPDDTPQASPPAVADAAAQASDPAVAEDAGPEAPVLAQGQPADSPAAAAPLFGSALGAPPTGSWQLRVHYGDYSERNVVATLDYSIEIEGGRYRMRTEGRAEGLTKLLYSGVLAQASVGRVGINGLQPERYSEQRGKRAERWAQVDYASREVTFSGGQRTPLVDGVQDRLTVLMQLSLLARAQPQRFVAGASIEVPELATSEVLAARYAVLGDEVLETEQGPLRALHLERVEPRRADGPRIEVWLGYDHHLIPVRIRATDIGGRVLDQLLAR